MAKKILSKVTGVLVGISHASDLRENLLRHRHGVKLPVSYLRPLVPLSSLRLAIAVGRLERGGVTLEHPLRLIPQAHCLCLFRFLILLDTLLLRLRVLRRLDRGVACLLCELVGVERVRLLPLLRELVDPPAFFQAFERLNDSALVRAEGLRLRLEGVVSARVQLEEILWAAL